MFLFQITQARGKEFSNSLSPLEQEMLKNVKSQLQLLDPIIQNARKAEKQGGF